MFLLQSKKILKILPESYSWAFTHSDHCVFWFFWNILKIFLLQRFCDHSNLLPEQSKHSHWPLPPQHRHTGTMVIINKILQTILLKGVRNNTVSGGCSSSEWRDGLEAETFAVKLQKAACISICSHHRHHDNNPWSCHYFILILIIRQATPQCMPENTSIRFLSMRAAMIMMTMVALVKNTGWSEKTELESTKNGLTQWLFLIRYTWRGQGQVEKENCLRRSSLMCSDVLREFLLEPCLHKLEMGRSNWLDI